MRRLTTLSDFTNAVEGLWVNPVTRNHYLFTPDKIDSSKGQVSVIQQGENVPVALNIELMIKNEELIIYVEGSEYEVFVSDQPVRSLKIRLSADIFVELIKNGYV
jgi:hypothetical protein